MRKVFIASLALTCLSISILLFQITSCTKAQADPVKCPDCPTCPPPPTPTFPVEGLWIGTYSYTPGTNTYQNPQYFSFIIKPGGKMLLESQDRGVDYLATGTWTLVDGKLKCIYTYPTSVLGTKLYQVSIADFNNSGTLRNAVWYNTDVNGVEVTDPAQHGTFTLDRIN